MVARTTSFTACLLSSWLAPAEIPDLPALERQISQQLLQRRLVPRLVDAPLEQLQRLDAALEIAPLDMERPQPRIGGQRLRRFGRAQRDDRGEPADRPVRRRLGRPLAL